MEDSFKVRVDRIFGALAVPSSASASASASASSLTSVVSPMKAMWCLTDHEIERKEWKRENHDQELGEEVAEWKDDEARYDLTKDVDELDDEFEPGADSSPRVRPAEYDDEEWEIRSAIGRDCTLDYEEEEDAYDKVAVGSEQVGDRLYMKEFRDYGIDINHGSELPTSLKCVPRDPRANHMAAKIRLKEDAEEASKVDYVHVSEVDTPFPGNAGEQSSEENAYLKPILKRKDCQPESKMEKRVKFDRQCMEEASPGLDRRSCATIGASIPKQEFDAAVPDYVQNPSRYTHYTFDSSSEMDEQSNRHAYMDLFSMLRGSKTYEEQGDAVVDLPKSIAFMPKKKAGGAADVANFTGTKYDENDPVKEAALRKGFPVSISAGDAQDGDVCAMEEDQPEESVSRTSSVNKSGRQYRTKALTEADE